MRSQGGPRLSTMPPRAAPTSAAKIAEGVLDAEVEGRIGQIIDSNVANKTSACTAIANAPRISPPAGPADRGADQRVVVDVDDELDRAVVAGLVQPAACGRGHLRDAGGDARSALTGLLAPSRSTCSPQPIPRQRRSRDRRGLGRSRADRPGDESGHGHDRHRAPLRRRPRRAPPTEPPTRRRRVSPRVKHAHRGEAAWTTVEGRSSQTRGTNGAQTHVFGRSQPVTAGHRKRA